MSEGGDSGRADGAGVRSPAHVVVLGGGFGGLEAAFDLRRLVGKRARITLISDQDHFLFKPNSIYVPFGLDPARLRVPLAGPAARRGIALRRFGSAAEVAEVAAFLAGPRSSYVTGQTINVDGGFSV